MVVKVLLVDDDALVRASLRLILSSAEDLEVVGEVGDGAEALDAVDRFRPDVVMMDIRMPVLDGIRATEHLLARPSPPRVIVLTTFAADEYVMQALRAGADGFLLKDTPPPEIVQAVRHVAAGEASLSPSVTRTLLGHVGDSGARRRVDEARARLAVLTDREREVARAVGEGGVERGDRCVVVDERGHREGPHDPTVGQAGLHQPGPGGHPRPRGWAGLTLVRAVGRPDRPVPVTSRGKSPSGEQR